MFPLRATKRPEPGLVLLFRELSRVQLSHIGGLREYSIPLLRMFSAKKKKKRNFLRSLQEDGGASLMVANIALSFRKHGERKTDALPMPTVHSKYLDGVWTSWWESKFKESCCDSTVVQSHDTSVRDACVLSLRNYFPKESVLTHVMFRVCELLNLGSKLHLRCLNPQLFTSSRCGKTTRFWKDYSSPNYRCFLYLGIEYSPDSRSFQAKNIDAEDYTFVSSGAKMVMDVSCDDNVFMVVTFRGLFEEGMHKYCLFPGDIIILDGTHPWSIDLPYYQKARNTRMLSWCIFEEEKPSNIDDPNTSCKSGFPVLLPRHPRQLRFYDKVLHIPSVWSRYNEDLQKTKECKGVFQTNFPENKGCLPNDQHSVIIFMELLRVTPRRYKLSDIFLFLRSSSTIFCITSLSFQEQQAINGYGCFIKDNL